MHENAPTLRELQRWMRWIITDPRGVCEALGDPKALRLAPENRKYRRSRYREPIPSCAQWIVSRANIERLSVYAEGYFLRLKEVLEQDFPRAKDALGKRFHPLVVAYLKEHPSRFRSLSEVGRRLPVFLSHHSYPPGLCELARFEWEFHEALFRPSVVSSVGKTVTTKTKVRFHPQYHLFKTEWNIVYASTKRLRKTHRRFYLIGRMAGKIVVEPIPAFICYQGGRRFQSLVAFCRRVILPTSERREVSRVFTRWSKLGILQYLE